MIFARSFLLLLIFVLTSASGVLAVESDLTINHTSHTPGYLHQWVAFAEDGMMLDLGHVALQYPNKPVPVQPKRISPLAPAVNRPALASKTYPESSYDPLFEQFGLQFNVPAATLKKIAYCESHYNPLARSKNNTYGGMYQFSSSTWVSTRTAMGMDSNPELRFDAEQSILTAAFKIAAGGIKAWPTCSS